MIISKAIKLLALIDHADDWEIDEEDIGAIKLGVEALKRIEHCRR